MKTVMVFGTFDIVHHGHLDLFKQARKQGDRLIAVVARDERVEKLKKKTSVYSEKERKYFLEQIRLLDEVVLGDQKDVYKVIKKIKPDCIVLGYDQIHFTDKLAEKIKQFGLNIRIVRAKPHRQNKFKTAHIRKKLEKEY